MHISLQATRKQRIRRLNNAVSNGWHLAQHFLSSQEMNYETFNPLQWQTIIDSINIAHLLLLFSLTVKINDKTPRIAPASKTNSIKLLSLCGLLFLNIWPIASILFGTFHRGFPNIAHTIHGTGIFPYICHQNQPFM